MMMMTCLDLYKKSEITICVHLQNIVVVYRDMFEPLHRKSGITTCVLLQDIVVVYRYMFVPLSRKSWNNYMCTFTRHRSSISRHACTSF